MWAAADQSGRDGVLAGMDYRASAARNQMRCAGVSQSQPVWLPDLFVEGAAFMPRVPMMMTRRDHSALRKSSLWVIGCGGVCSHCDGAPASCLSPGDPDCCSRHEGRSPFHWARKFHCGLKHE